MDVLRTELENRWVEMFTTLAHGADVPPSRRLRTEGMMQAAVLSGSAAEAELIDAMDACYIGAFGRTLSEDFGARWRDFFPFPQIPAMAVRAPVYPSTRD